MFSKNNEIFYLHYVSLLLGINFFDMAQDLDLNERLL